MGMNLPGRGLASATNEVPREGEKAGVRERTKATVVCLFLHKCIVLSMHVTMPCLVLSLHIHARRHHRIGDRLRAVLHRRASRHYATVVRIDIRAVSLVTHDELLHRKGEPT